MGKTGNKARGQSRRVREALARQEKELGEATESSTDAQARAGTEELIAILNDPIPDGLDEAPWDDDFNNPDRLTPEVQQALGNMGTGGLTTRTITVRQDHILDFPQLYLEVHVEGPPQDTFGFAQMFARAQCKKAKSLETADLVVFGGGPDVDPALYGAKPHSKTYIDPERDTADINAYMKCMSLGIPMMGVCRGAQFLSVMNGGKLFQDIDNHQTSHPIFDTQTGLFIERASSLHHQAAIANEDMVVLATASRSLMRWKDPQVCETAKSADVEAFFYPDTACLGIQGHPEYSGYDYFTVWSLKLLERWIVYQKSLDWVEQNGEKHLRLGPDALEKAKLRAGVISTISRMTK